MSDVDIKAATAWLDSSNMVEEEPDQAQPTLTDAARLLGKNIVDATNATDTTAAGTHAAETVPTVDVNQTMMQ